MINTMIQAGGSVLGSTLGSIGQGRKQQYIPHFQYNEQTNRYEELEKVAIGLYKAGYTEKQVRDELSPYPFTSIKYISERIIQVKSKSKIMNILKYGLLYIAFGFITNLLDGSIYDIKHDIYIWISAMLSLLGFITIESFLESDDVFDNHTKKFTLVLCTILCLVFGWLGASIISALSDSPEWFFWLYNGIWIGAFALFIGLIIGKTR